MAVHVLKSPVSADALAARLAAAVDSPVAVVAMGSPWRGDDAAALRVADRLAGLPGLGPRRLFNVETAPESFLIPIGTCGAKSCILLDALDAGASPGDVVLLEPEDLEHTDFTTHGLSPKAFLAALAELSGMTLLVLGIQMGPIREGDRVSDAVGRAAEAVAEALGRVCGAPPTGDTDDPPAAGTSRDGPDAHGA